MNKEYFCYFFARAKKANVPLPREPGQFQQISEELTCYLREMGHFSQHYGTNLRTEARGRKWMDHRQMPPVLNRFATGLCLRFVFCGSQAKRFGFHTGLFRVGLRIWTVPVRFLCFQFIARFAVRFQNHTDIGISNPNCNPSRECNLFEYVFITQTIPIEILNIVSGWWFGCNLLFSH